MKNSKSLLYYFASSILLFSSCKKDGQSGCTNGNAIFTLNNNTNSAINITVGGQVQNNVAVGGHGGFTLTSGSYNVRYVPTNAPNAAYNEVNITLASCETKEVTAETQWGDCVVNNTYNCYIYNDRFVSYSVYVDGIFKGSLSYTESLNVSLSAGTHTINATTSAIGYGDRSATSYGSACSNDSWTIQ